MPVAILNQAAVREYFREENPIGKRVRWAREESVRWMTIIGVVSDITPAGLDTKEAPAIYTAFPQESNWWRSWMNVVVRTSVEPAALTAEVRSEVSHVDRNIPVAEIYTMDELIKRSVSDRRFNLFVLGSFAIVAMVLAAIGIYGVVSFMVKQKVHEIGVRVALGASKRDIYRLVLGNGVKLTVIGIVLGLCGALYLTRFLQTMLFEVQRNDPLTTLIGAIVLSSVALIATYLPARRAIRVDPSTALRYE